MLTSATNLFEALGSGYSLLCVGTQASARDLWLQASDVEGIPLQIIHQDVGGEADRYEASWILVRPDQFVAWTSDVPEIDIHLIHTLLQHLKGEQRH
jgi:hypothetical protein